MVGGLLLLAGAPALWSPGLARRLTSAFPRNDWAARLLIALALVWTASIVLNAPLGRFEHLKPALYVVTPLAFFLIVYFMDELLAPRALGGLLLLGGNPILNAIRWYETPWRLVVTVTVYLAVMAGIVLVLSPYRFRQWTSACLATDERSRATGTLFCGVGLLLLVLATTVF